MSVIHEIVSLMHRKPCSCIAIFLLSFSISSRCASASDAPFARERLSVDSKSFIAAFRAFIIPHNSLTVWNICDSNSSLIYTKCTRISLVFPSDWGESNSIKLYCWDSTPWLYLCEQLALFRTCFLRQVCGFEVYPCPLNATLFTQLLVLGAVYREYIPIKLALWRHPLGAGLGYNLRPLNAVEHSCRWHTLALLTLLRHYSILD